MTHAISLALVGFAVFRQSPSSDQIQSFLDRAIQTSRFAPRYMIGDEGKQFWCRSVKRWCKRRGIRPRYGRVAEPAGIAIVERFSRSMKSECTRLLLLPMSLAGMRRELRLYATWYNAERPHMALGGNTPQELWASRERRRRRVEPRTNWLHRHRRRDCGERFTLGVSYIEGRKHLPAVTLRQAA